MYLERIFQQEPSKIAVRSGDLIYSYGQLYTEAWRLAAYLKQGEGPLMVYGHKHPRMIVALLACLLSGRPWLPCDASVPAGRMTDIAALCGVKELFLTEDMESSLDGISAFGWEKIRETDTVENIHFEAEQIAYIMFTSGSTGTPKGIPISVGSVENFAGWLLSHKELAEASGCVINQANLSFDLSVADWCAALCSGGTLLLTTKREQFCLWEFFACIREQEGRLLVCTPTFLRLCLCDRAFCRASLPSLQAVFLCGEVLPRATAALTKQRFPDLSLFNAYGPTEATCAVCGLLIREEHLMQEPLPVGRIDSAAVEIMLEDGEICLKGASVFEGYVGQKPIGHPYRSGDLGKIENGLLYCLGRKDSQIKYMGYRIDLEEIRLALEALPGIQQAAVSPQRDNKGIVRKLVAYLSPLPEDTESIRCQLAKKLPQYMLPSLFYPLEQLPVSPNVKSKTR